MRAKGRVPAADHPPIGDALCPRAPARGRSRAWGGCFAVRQGDVLHPFRPPPASQGWARAPVYKMLLRRLVRAQLVTVDQGSPA